MMDSQENALQQGTMAEEQQEAVTAAEEVQNTNAEPQAENDSAVPVAKQTFKSKEEVLARLKELASSEETPDKEEVDHLKTVFYKMHVAERDEKQRQYLEAGGDPEKYQVLPDDDEKEFKVAMGVIREKRAALFMQQEAEKQENLKRKQEIIEKIKAMATSPDEANKSFQEFKALQQEWKEIKAVPAEKANELWRNYQL